MEIEKKYSWVELKQLKGTEKIILSTGSNANAIFLQQPFFFSVVKKGNLSINAAFLPSDITIKIPISPNYFAFPYADTSIFICNNISPFPSPAGFIDLKKLDPALIKINTYFPDFFKCMAINKNDNLFLSYQNKQLSQPFTFFLCNIKASNIDAEIQILSTRQVTIPRTDVSGFVRFITSIEDYFLVHIAGHGVFKVKEDGSFKKVAAGTIINTCYEWQGNVYAHTAGNKVLISIDKSDSFQEFGTIPNFMVLSNYYQVKDSLIGVNRDNLFTLKWTNNSYSVRFIRNDGVEGTTINGVEILKDSVYVATTSGLFVKPISTFFDSK